MKLHPITKEKIDWEHRGTHKVEEDQFINWMKENCLTAFRMLMDRFGREQASNIIQKSIEGQEEYIRNETAKCLSQVSGNDTATFTIEMKSQNAYNVLTEYRQNMHTFNEAMDDVYDIVQSMKTYTSKHQYDQSL